MTDIDEILASGRYTDRRGRVWFKAVFSWRWESPLRIDPGKGQTYLSISREAMRLLIERDHHRDECLGLWTCTDHPVPAVTLSRRFRPRVYVDGEPYLWFDEAMDAARALAVER